MHLLFAHATGFCGACWRPVRARLGEYSSTVWDFRGHGASRSSRDRRSWWETATDALSVRDAALAEAPEGTRVVGVGHSMGGASLVMAELLSPGSFDALVLIEPIIFGPPFARDPDHPLVGLALRRRDTFESRDAVLASYASKPPFAAWDRAALEGYVEGGFIEVDGVTRLACRPTSEAEVFTAAGAHAAWERLSEVSTPTTILYGANTDTYPPGHAEALAARFGNATAAAVEDTGHFLPMERPQVVVATVRERIDGLR
ncbi:MAG: alpha/beta hydrolase [Acidimicrobiia bacterium]